MRKHRSQQLFGKIIVRLALVLALPACSAINTLNTKPFEDYQNAITTLKQESDQALQAAYQQELDQFKSDLADGDNSRLSSFVIQFPLDEPFAWSYPRDNQGSVKPLFISIADMQQTLTYMNSQLLTYAGLLVALAGADERAQFDVQAEAQRFSANASSLMGRLNQFNIDTSRVDSQGLALFSTAAAMAAEAYLENKRSALLVDVLRAGIGPLKTFVETAQEAISVTAQGVKDKYQDQIKAAVREVLDAKGNDRIEYLENLIGQNNELTQQLELLRNIHKSYGAIPASQRQLITAVNQEGEVNLAELNSYIVNIRQQVEYLKSSDGTTTN